MLKRKCETNIALFDSIKIECGECEGAVEIKEIKSQFTSCPNCGHHYNTTLIDQLQQLILNKNSFSKLKDKLILINELNE